MVTRQSGAYLDEPKRQTRFGLLKVFLTVITGLSIGAWVSQKMAAFLEENELFVPEDDDDDDDDDDWEAHVFKLEDDSEALKTKWTTKQIKLSLAAFLCVNYSVFLPN